MNSTDVGFVKEREDFILALHRLLEAHDASKLIEKLVVNDDGSIDVTWFA